MKKNNNIFFITTEILTANQNPLEFKELEHLKQQTTSLLLACYTNLEYNYAI